jgi:hypothetical protein
VAREIAARRVPPTVYAVVDPSAGCQDVPDGPQALTFLTQDVPAALAQGYRVAQSSAGRAVFGATPATAYCAAAMPLRAPDVYGAAAAPYGTTTEPAGDLYGGSRAIRAENDLAWRLRNLPAPPVALLLGRDDQLTALARPPLRVESGGGSVPEVLRRLAGWVRP